MSREGLRRRSVALGVGLLMLGLSPLAQAWKGGAQHHDERHAAMERTPDIAKGKEIFQRCSHCHDQSAYGMVPGISRLNVPGYYPRLAGQHRNVLIKQLADIRSGNRDNPSMYPFTLDRNLNGAQGIADVTAYIATLPDDGPHDIGPGGDLDHGEALYKENCSKCHGDYGEGSNEDFYPRLQGQHYAYMLRQMQWIKIGKRRNANQKMREQIANFSYRDMSAVVDYVSRLQPLPVEEAAKP